MRAQSGYTLIEILISMVILAVGLLALNAMQATFATGSGDSRSFTRAAQVASQQMEELRNADYDASDVQDTNSTGPTDHGPESVSLNGLEISISWTVEEIATSTKSITVTADWNYKGRDKSVTVSGVKTKIESEQ